MLVQCLLFYRFSGVHAAKVHILFQLTELSEVKLEVIMEVKGEVKRGS